MEENQSFLDLQVDPETSTSLVESTRWGKLLAVGVLIAIALGFAMVALMWSVIVQLFVAAEPGVYTADYANGLLIGVIVAFVVVFVIVGILMSFLIQAHNRIKKGIRTRDQYTFNRGLASLKNYFAMYGVLSILGLLSSIIGLLKN